LLAYRRNAQASATTPAMKTTASASVRIQPKVYADKSVSSNRKDASSFGSQPRLLGSFGYLENRIRSAVIPIAVCVGRGFMKLPNGRDPVASQHRQS